MQGAESLINVAFGYRTSYQYNVLNNLTSVSQGIQSRSFLYDSLSRLTSAANPESGTVAYDYDNNGNLLHKTDARPVTTTFAYDALNRAISKSYNDNPQTPTVTYFYDSKTPQGAPTFDHGFAKGRLTSVNYGAKGLVEIRGISANEPTRTFTFEEEVTALDFSPDGKHLVFGTDKGQIALLPLQRRRS